VTIKQVFEDEGVLRPHPPAKIIQAFKAGFEAGEAFGESHDSPLLSDTILNKAFYEWWENQ
jgi:hypothetical protein